MSDQGLNEAFNDCINRLNAGQSLQDCLQLYPQYADELQALLLAGAAVRQLRVPDREVAAARERVRARLSEPARAVPVRRWGWSRVAMAAGLVLVLAAVLRGGAITWEQLHQPTPTAIITLTAVPTWTATPTQITPSATASLTATVTATTTATREEPSATATVVRLTNTASPTPSSTPDVTATPVCPPVQPDGWVSYEVQTGDTLSGLAGLTDTTVEDLSAVNCLADDVLIVIGEELFLPVEPPATTAPASTGDDGDSGDSATGSDEPDAGDDDPDGGQDTGGSDTGSGHGQGSGNQNQGGGGDGSSPDDGQGNGSGESGGSEHGSDHDDESDDSDESDEADEVDDADEAETESHRMEEDD